VAKDRKEGLHLSRGFSLIELLTVVAILSILLAISIPNYWKFRQFAYNVQARFDVSTLRTAMIASNSDTTSNLNFLPCSDDGCETIYTGFRRSPEVSIAVTIPGGGGDFVITASHAEGSLQYQYISIGEIYLSNPI
jgi:prepilin-type N-terminal cleavage/methylation domain-containing protein